MDSVKLQIFLRHDRIFLDMMEYFPPPNVGSGMAKVIRN